MRNSKRPDVPYHRVIAAGGRLGGYGGREVLKRALLLAEGVIVSGMRVRELTRVRWTPGSKLQPTTYKPKTSYFSCNLPVLSCQLSNGHNVELLMVQLHVRLHRDFTPDRVLQIAQHGALFFLECAGDLRVHA